MAFCLQIEDRPTVPLLLVGSPGSVNSLQELFSNNDYFSFDPQKVGQDLLAFYFMLKYNGHLSIY